MEKNEIILNYLMRSACEALGKDINVESASHIQDLGFDSKTLVIFCDLVSSALHEEIHPGVFFEYETLELFANYLLEYKGESVERLVAVLAKDRACETSTTPATNSVKAAEDDVWKTFDLENGDLSVTNVEHGNSQTAMGGEANGIPVIIGGGISGMLISHSLCKAGVPHVIVGKPEIGDSPKLGESMTEVVSIEFTRKFPHLSQYFFPKKFTPFYMGDLVAGLRFKFFESLSSIFLEENEAPKQFIHVDRIGFDRAIYDEIVNASECTWVDSLVDELEYSSDSDSVAALHLQNGQVLTPSFVWDCTNHVRLLGRKIGLPSQELDARREVVFTHYSTKGADSVCEASDHPWMHATSLLRADQEFDDLKGVSWLIPLGSYVSVGISMMPEDIGDRTSEEIIALLTKAYKRRGLDYSKLFPLRKEVVHVPSQHFIYDRFYGNNWALVGGSSSSTWFTSGSNLSIVAFMASIAEKILKDTPTYGEYYSKHIQGFLRTQEIYNTFMDSNTGTVDAIRFLSGIIEQARSRISSFFILGEGTGEKNSDIARSLWEETVSIDRNYFEFLRQIAVHASPDSRDQQTNAIFMKLEELQNTEEKIRLPYLRENRVREDKPELFQHIA